MINQFQGEYSFLSNFYLCNIKLGVLVFPSSEHMFMACKNNSKEWIYTCASNKYTPGQIKRLGRQIKLIYNWDEFKLSSMKFCITQKFKQNPDLLAKLVATGDEELVEGNTWGDVYWGVCLKTGVGENQLGKILMEVREELNCA